MTESLKSFRLIVAMLLLPAAAAAQTTPALQISGGFPSILDASVVGWEFTVTTDVQVEQLGLFDIDGLGGDGRQVRLYDLATHSVLSTAMIAPGTPGAPAGAYAAQYTPIAPVRLAPGTPYLLAAQAPPNDTAMLTTPTFAPEVQWQAGLTGLPGVAQLPDLATEFHIYPAMTGSFMGPTFTFRQVPPLVDVSLGRNASPRVVQRNNANVGQIPLAGTLTGGQVDRVEARAVVRDGYGGATTDWQVIDTPAGGSFSGVLTATGGWYDIEVRAFTDGYLVGTQSVEKVGVGEVFITAGQSNSACFGQPAQRPDDPRVLALNYGGSAPRWQTANDPQPNLNSGGSGGSAWPEMGDRLSALYDVPIGIVSCGYGGASVTQWQPGGGMYANLNKAIDMLGPEGFRAILWHQGETDSANGTSPAAYAQLLEAIIAQSRGDAGFDVPWGVALASYLPGASAANEARIVEGQLMVIDADPLVFKGAETDAYHLLGWLSDSVHFNDTGLKDHGRQWAEAIDAAGIVIPEPACAALLLAGAAALLARRRMHKAG